MSKLNLLVVDDASFIRDFIRRGLASALPMVAILEAINGRVAQNMLENKAIDLVLCDWEMPEVDGYQLLQWVRADERFANLPFIMVTSRGERAHVATALQSGIDGYVVKPFRIETLIARIHEAMARRGRVMPAADFPVPPSPVQGPFADSVAILTGGLKREAPRGGGKGANPLARVAAQIRFGNMTLRCLLQKLDLAGAAAVVLREGGFPTLLEPVVLDLTIETPNLEASGINGFISSLEAVEHRPDSRFVRLGLRYVDEDPQKREQLAKFIAAL